MKPGLKIVSATTRHLDQLVPLFSAYLDFYKCPAAKAKIRKFLRDRLQRGESVIYLAMHDGDAVGFVQLYPTFVSLALKRSWILYDLFVTPEARKKGVARALMNRARRLARETGAEGLTLDTAITNRPAQRLYEGLGWKQDKKFYRYHRSA